MKTNFGSKERGPIILKELGTNLFRKREIVYHNIMYIGII